MVVFGRCETCRSWGKHAVAHFRKKARRAPTTFAPFGRSQGSSWPSQPSRKRGFNWRAMSCLILSTSWSKASAAQGSRTSWRSLDRSEGMRASSGRWIRLLAVAVNQPRISWSWWEERMATDTSVIFRTKLFSKAAYPCRIDRWHVRIRDPADLRRPPPRRCTVQLYQTSQCKTVRGARSVRGAPQQASQRDRFCGAKSN